MGILDQLTGGRSLKLILSHCVLITMGRWDKKGMQSVTMLRLCNDCPLMEHLLCLQESLCWLQGKCVPQQSIRLQSQLHTYQRVGPTKINETYFWVNMNRFVLSVSFGVSSIFFHGNLYLFDFFNCTVYTMGPWNSWPCVFIHGPWYSFPDSLRIPMFSTGGFPPVTEYELVHLPFMDVAR